MQSAPDVPLHIRSDNAASERRVSPAWSLAQFKARLEPITGIPADAQTLLLSSSNTTRQQQGTGTGAGTSIAGARAGAGTLVLEAADEHATLLSSFPLEPYLEVFVRDTRPPALRQTFDPDHSNVPKYVMPTQTYEALDDSVLAWKRKNKLGRFDPTLPDANTQLDARSRREAEERGIALDRRCKLMAPPVQAPAANSAKPAEDGRRGTVRYLGPVEEIPGPGIWIGVVLDEPTGKNDGSIKGKKYFQCPSKHGVFVRPERVEIGDFPVLDDLDEDMVEI